MTPKRGTVSGSRLGSCRIIEKIGEGGMGVVYLAEDQLLNRRVAIKVMSEEMAAQPEFQKRFLREAQTASSLTHPNIAQIHQLAEQDGAHYIVMEYVPGRSLHDWMHSREPMTFPQAVAIIKQVTTALGAAHSQGLVHRDVKPANIMCGADGTVKLLDFGLAKWRHRPKGGSSYETTTESTIIGTVDYMSPEMALQAEVDGRGDLFSLGIIFYELLTEERPFRGRNNIEILFEITRPEPARLNTEGIPADLVTIIQRLLEKDPADRYQTAAELFTDLDAVDRSLISGKAVLRRRRFRRKQVVAASVIAVMIIAAVVTSVALWRQWYENEPAHPARTTAHSIPAITVLPIADRVGDARVKELSLPLTHLLISSLRPVRSLDVLDFEALLTVPDIANSSAFDTPDEATYSRIRSLRRTDRIVRPLLMRTGGYWQAIVEFRDPVNGNLVNARTCRQETGTDAEGSLGLLVDSIAREIVREAGGNPANMAAPVPTPPAKLLAQREYAEGARLSAAHEHLLARDAFERARHADPDDPLVLLRLTQEARSLGRENEAVAFAQSASRLINESMNIAQGYEIEAALAEVTYKFDRAIDLLRKLVNMYPRRAEYMQRIGMIEHHTGDYGGAERSWRSALQRSDRHAPSMLALAGLCAEQSRYDEAESWYSNANAVYESTGNREGHGAVLTGLAEIDYRRDRVDPGKKKYEDALAIYRELGHEQGIAECLQGLGMAQRAAGEIDRSDALLREARGIAERLGNPAALAALELSRARLLLSRGDYRGVYAAGREATAIAERCGSRLLRAKGLDHSARALYYQGDFKAAEPMLREALAELERTSSRRDAGYVLEALSSIAYGTAEFDKCIEMCAKGEQIAAEIDDGDLMIRLRGTRAEIEYYRAGYAEALAIRLEALERATSRGSEEAAAYYAFNAARCQVALGRIPEALSLTESAARYFRKIDNKAMLGLVLFTKLQALEERVAGAEIAPVAEECASALESASNEAYAILGKATRAIYAGSATERRKALESAIALLDGEEVDIFVRLEVELLAARLAIQTGRVDAARESGKRLLALSEKLRMPEYACRAHLILRGVEPAGGGSAASLPAAGRRWYAALIEKIPAGSRAQFLARHTVAQMTAQLGAR